MSDNNLNTNLLESSKEVKLNKCIHCSKLIEEDCQQLGFTQYHKDCYKKVRECLNTKYKKEGLIPLHDYVKATPQFNIEPCEIVHEFGYNRNNKKYIVRVLLDIENIITVFVYDDDEEGMLQYDTTSKGNVFYVFDKLLVPILELENYALSLIEEDKERADRMFKGLF